MMNIFEKTSAERIWGWGNGPVGKVLAISV